MNGARTENMTIDEMKKRKKELGYSNEYLAELSGVPLGTVQKIFGGITKAPRRSTIIALERALADGVGSFGVDYSEQEPLEMYLRDALPEYGQLAQGRYTVYDYEALPEDRKVELIDGVFYDMVSPSVVHQIILGELYKILDNCIADHKCDCNVFFASFSIQVDGGIHTMVEPDLFVICDDKGLRRNKYIGAPEFIAEIVSPSSRSRDMFIKLNKYRFSGVREYWIIDPKYRVVQVYDLEHETQPEKYSFTDMIPVLISEGGCEVDFSKIDSKIAKYYDLED